MKTPLNICIIAGSLGVGGAEKQLFYLCKALKEKNVNLFVIGLTNGEFYEEPIKGLGVNFITLANIKNPISKLIKILTLVKKNKIDIIQSSHTFTNLYVGIVGKLTNTLSIGSLRSSYEYSKRSNGRLTKPMLLLPDIIFFNSQAAIDETLSLKVIKQDAAQLLHNVIETNKYTAGVSEQKAAPLDLIFVGKIQHSKGIETLLEATKLIREENSSVYLKLVGGGKDLDYYKHRAKELCIDDITDFIGNSDKVIAYLKSNSIFIFPSLSEGFPNVVIEAMAAGLPVITTPAGDVNLIVENNESGFIIDYNSPEEIAEKVNFFAHSPELIAQYGKTGQSIVKNRFDYLHLPKTILNLYIKAAAYKQKADLQQKIKAYF